MFDIKKLRILRILKILFPLLLFGLAIYEIQNMIRDIDMNIFQTEVKLLKLWELVIILIVSFIALMPMFLYDVILIKILGIKMKVIDLTRNSLIINTLSNLIGFGGLIGVMLRSYFYSKYNVDSKKLLKHIATVTLYYMAGISFLVWIAVIFYWDYSLLRETKWLLISCLLISLYFPIFIGIQIIRFKKEKTFLQNTRLPAQLLGTSILEWIFILLLILFIAFILNIPIGLTSLIPIFLVASCAGSVSMIPGGFGSFDLVFLLGTKSIGIADEKVLFLLILYRVGYFILPFIISCILFISEYWRHK